MELDMETNQDVTLEEDVQPKVDLNTATVEMLSVLPGIGEVMAKRIVAYRDAEGPFSMPEELMSVSGIGSSLYEQVADRVIVTLPEQMYPTVADTESGEGELLPAIEPPAEAVAGGERLLSVRAEPEPEPESEVALEARLDDVTVSEDAEFVLPSPEGEAAAEPVAPEPPSPSREEPASKPEKRQKGDYTWLWVALAGGFLGLIFSMLVLSGINGSLDMNHSRAVVAVRGDLEDITVRMDSLQGDVDGLRQRLDVLEGLTARMDKTEDAVAALQDDLDTLDSEAEALSQEVDVLSEELTTVAAETEKAQGFFEGLRDLVNEIFGAALLESEATPTPEE